MSAPVRLCPPMVTAPRSLLGDLPRLTALDAPSWIGARPSPTRLLVAQEAPAPIVETPTPSAAPALAVDAEALVRETAAARAVAEQEAIAAGQAKVDAIVERYAEAIARLAEVETRRASADAQGAVDLAMIVAQEILGHALTLDREFLMTALSEALAMVGTDGPMRVRIGSTDLAYLEAVRPDMLSDSLQLVEDDTLGIGGCVVESEHRVVDATVDARLAAIAQALRGALAEAPVAAEGSV